MKVDRLFMEKDCPDCGSIRAILDMDAVTRDDFRGTEGQELRVFISLSNEASVELLDKFNLSKEFMPVLVTHEDKVIRKPDRILAHLRKNEMTVND
jgi:hypothetical protein